MSEIVLADESHSANGCDRVVLDGQQVLVQGKPRLGYSTSSGLVIPEGEILTSISPEVFLAAARELEKRIR